MAQPAPLPAEILRTELERLFDLDAMFSLSRDLLALDPQSVGGTVSKAAFARALVERANAEQMLEALADAIALREPATAERLRGVYEGAPADDLAAGVVIDGFKIGKKLSTEGFGAVYQATSADGVVATFKILREGRTRDRRGIQRFLLAQRVLRTVEHPAVQKILGVGLTPDGRPWLAAEAIDGTLLSARVGRVGAMHINEARPILEALAEGLEKVHKAGLTHSDLRLDHVMLVRKENQLAGVLIDFAVDRMASVQSSDGDNTAMLLLLGSARTIAPERARLLQSADVRSDVYGFACMTYELLSGKPPFTGATAMDLIVAHITQTPEPPSKLAPRGWVNKEVDAVVLKGLNKDPKDRFDGVQAFVTALNEAVKGKKPEVSSDEFAMRKAALLQKPADEEAALSLESAGGRGVAWTDVLTAFKEIIDKVDDESARKALLFRAARIAQLEVKDLAQARGLYEQIVALDEFDEIARTKLYETRMALATPAEKAEILLEQAEKEELVDKRALIYIELAHVYERETRNNDEALTALTLALCDNPSLDHVARDIERLAGDNASAWNDTIQAIQSSIKDHEKDTAAATRLLVRSGGWYGDKVSRPDFALACFNQALAMDPGNDGALEGAAGIYRKAQQWNELVAVLFKRADIVGQGARARELRADAASVLSTRLSDDRRARDVLERVLAEDPAQPKAIETLEKIYLAAEDWPALVSLLEKKAEALSGSARADAICEIAETYEDRIKDDAKAVEAFERATVADARNLAALKGLERLYARKGDAEKLLRTLELQVAVSPTPRQKVDLYNRIASIHEEEFVDTIKATEAFEAAVAIDPANDTALTGLARVYRVKSRWDDLAALLERHAGLVDEPRRRADLLVSRGRVLLDPIGAPDRAGQAFEKALELDPNHPGALEGAAKVRALRGDVKAAAEALDMLAAQAKTPQEKAEAWFRAGRVLEDKGDRDGAIERYKHAIDNDDSFAPATARLRELYAARGDSHGAIEMLQREIESAEGMLARAKLWNEVARIYREQLKDDDKALEAAQKAIVLDATNEDANTLVGEIRFDRGEFADAAKLLSGRATRAKDLPKDEGVRITLRHGEALARSGEAEKALAAFKAARALAPDDRTVLVSVARANFQVGQYEQAREVLTSVLDRFGKEMDRNDRIDVLFLLGQTAGKMADGSSALRYLTEAADAGGNNLAVLDALADAYAQQGKWDDVVRVRRKRIESSPEAERFDRYLDLGEQLASKANDRTGAARAFMSALEVKPDDRKLLMKLMQLYSEEKDWGRLVEIILRLADLVDDRTQLSKYYLTAAQLSHVQLNRPEEAVDYYELALENDPTNVRAFEGLGELRRKEKDYEALASTLRKTLSRMPESASKTVRGNTHQQLGLLLAAELDQPSEAIENLEKARDLQGSLDAAASEVLAGLYLRDSKNNFDKAVRSQRALLAQSPGRAESIKALRKLYTEAKKPDEAWCFCQALTALKTAEPEEENFFKKFRADRPAAASEKVNDEGWTRDLVHTTQDPLITALFAIVQPAALALRGEKRENYGIEEKHRIDPAKDAGQMAQMIHYATGVLSIRTPQVYVHPNDDSGLNVMLTQPPGIFLGKAMTAGGPAQALAFLAGNRLSYYRAGHFLRQLVPTGTGLRAWLFAAIRTVNPSFPIAAEIQGTVNENMAAIRQAVTGPQLDLLTSVVSKVLTNAGSLDLKRWMTAVDLTADRAGFLLANDLPRSLAVIRATPDESSPIPQKDRVRELTSFAISEEYFRLRDKLGFAIRPAS